ncbi:uncharacterized protein [Pyrus communis]|uniref:uncharacterized protein n=1 Tax=Pyrus communis TaxID=23211 RepID=UPI0035C0776B
MPISRQNVNKNQNSVPRFAKSPTLLEKTCDLHRKFPEYFDVVVSVARKTDVDIGRICSLLLGDQQSCLRNASNVDGTGLLPAIYLFYSISSSTTCGCGKHIASPCSHILHLLNPMICWEIWTRDFHPLKLLKRNEVLVGPVNPVSCLATNGARSVVFP